jgi:hypothetical protein
VFFTIIVQYYVYVSKSRGTHLVNTFYSLQCNVFLMQYFIFGNCRLWASHKPTVHGVEVTHLMWLCVVTRQAEAYLNAVIKHSKGYFIRIGSRPAVIPPGHRYFFHSWRIGCADWVAMLSFVDLVQPFKTRLVEVDASGSVQSSWRLKQQALLVSNYSYTPKMYRGSECNASYTVMLPLIHVNWFHETLISDSSVNEPNFRIFFAFHCRAS